MEYDVITLDTSVFDSNGLNLTSGILAQLDQFKEGSAEFVMSEIVYREVLKHLTDELQKSRSRFDTLVKESPKQGLFTAEQCDALKTILDATASSSDAAAAKLKAFLEVTGCQIIPVKDVEVQKLVDNYFGAVAPFENSAKKKNEFPDALALMTLEKWGIANKKKILAISSDGGWSSFGKNSDHIDVENDLADALAKFQEHTKDITETLNVLLGKIEVEKSCPALLQNFQDCLTYAFENTHFYGVANSEVDLENESVTFEVDEFEFDSVSSNYNIAVVKTGASKVAFRMKILVTGLATGSFNMAIYDSIDKDYVSLGSLDVEEAITEDFEILVHLQGPLPTENPDDDLSISKIEILKGIKEIDFGYVEPPFYQE